METKKTIKERKDNAVQWIKDHKRGLITFAVMATFVGIGIYKHNKKTPEVMDGGVRVPDIEPMEVPEALSAFGVTDIDEYSGCYEFMTGYAGVEGKYPMKIEDLNKMKSIIVENFKDVDESSDIWMMVNIGKNSRSEKF